MPEALPIRCAVGYALNVFPYETLADLWACLEGDVLKIKAIAFPDEVFPIELRFSERLVRELQSDCDQVAKLKYFLDTHDFELVTVNGFVMPAFHGERVKERVYLPAWHESEQRVRFTNACLDLLAQLAPADAEFVSVSVPFGALKPVTMDAVAPSILRCAEHAAKIQQRTGVHCVVALEPEPGLCVETTAEVVEFFNAHVPESLRAHIGVNFDLSHQLVEFEDIPASLRLLQQNNVPVAKIHVSNAAEMTELTPFYEDSIYLHQVCGVNARGERVFFSLDWPSQSPPDNIVKFRVHYHLPVCPQPDSPVGTTLVEVEQFLRHSNTPALSHSIPFIIETYTWPEQLRGRKYLVENVCRELAWVREKISLSAGGAAL
jgi:sugar phosphate isomerase/epimerase